MAKDYIVMDEVPVENLAGIFGSNEEIGCLVCAEIYEKACEHDVGIGPYEYWGDTGWHHDYEAICCGCGNSDSFVSPEYDTKLNRATLENNLHPDYHIVILDTEDETFWNKLQELYEKAEKEGVKLHFVNDEFELANLLFTNFKLEEPK